MFHTMDAMLSLRMGVGQGAGIFFSHFCEFKSSLVQELELFQKFSLLGEFCKIHEIRDFRVP